VVFLACVYLTLFLALSLSAGNSLVSSWWVILFSTRKRVGTKPVASPGFGARRGKK